MTREEAYYILGLVVEGRPVTNYALKEACKITLEVFEELADLKDEINGVMRTVEGWKKQM